MTDPFAAGQDATRAHRSQHGCSAFTYADGTLPGAVAAAVGASRILELGTALGYTALWLAHGATHATVDTIEGDAGHVEFANEQVGRYDERRRDCPSRRLRSRAQTPRSPV